MRRALSSPRSDRKHSLELKPVACTAQTGHSFLAYIIPCLFYWQLGFREYPLFCRLRFPHLSSHHFPQLSPSATLCTSTHTLLSTVEPTPQAELFPALSPLHLESHCQCLSEPRSRYCCQPLSKLLDQTQSAHSPPTPLLLCIPRPTPSPTPLPPLRHRPRRPGYLLTSFHPLAARLHYAAVPPLGTALLGGGARNEAAEEAQREHDTKKADDARQARRLKNQHTHKRHATPAPAHTAPSRSDLLCTACAPSSHHCNGFCDMRVCSS
jgi:hypothetical protein